jgi:hypothetical protein
LKNIKVILLFICYFDETIFVLGKIDRLIVSLTSNIY